ncbi:uncharacterized protein LOC142823916 [Pelodiscus sinensis]|uniref:uncharacterized protein LOC142823916 n=1 Tax=Pelodiscus sinensis TaxID=13735 RepID=UPI003F6C3AE6
MRPLLSPTPPRAGWQLRGGATTCTPSTGGPKGPKKKGPILVLGGAGGTARLVAGGGGPPRHPVLAPQRRDLCPHGPGARPAGPSSPDPRASPGESKGAAPGLREGQRGPGDRSQHLPPLQPAPRHPGPASPTSPAGPHRQQHAPPPVTRTTETGEGDSSSRSEDEASTATLQAPSGSPDISRASLEAEEGSTAGPSTSRGPSSPAAAAAAPPAAQPPRQRLRHQDQLLQRHVQAVERVEAASTRRVEVDLQWHQEAWGAFQPQCVRMADSIATLTARIGHAVHYGIALPHAPTSPPLALPLAPPAMAPPAPAPAPPAMAPPAPPAPAPAPPAHLPVLPAPMRPAPHVQVRPRRSAHRGHPSQE